VVVGDENRVDGREVRNRDSGRVASERTENLEGTGAVGPDGVDKYVDTGGLDEERSMADAGDAEVVDARIGFEATARGDSFGPWSAFAEKTPAEDIEEALVGGGKAGVIELLAVEVVGCRAGIIAIRQYFRSFDCW
jgi:hypothetical protein